MFRLVVLSGAVPGFTGAVTGMPTVVPFDPVARVQAGCGPWSEPSQLPGMPIGVIVSGTRAELVR